MTMKFKFEGGWEINIDGTLIHCRSRWGWWCGECKATVPLNMYKKAKLLGVKLDSLSFLKEIYNRQELKHDYDKV